MKTIKFLSYLLVTVLCIGFTSCSDDEEEEKKDYSTLIVGNWKLDKAEGFDDNWNQTFTGEEYLEEYVYEDENNNDKGKITSFVINERGVGYVQRDDAESFTWSIAEDVLTLKGNEINEYLSEEPTYYIKTLNSNTLVIESTRIKAEGEGFIFTFKK